MKKILLFLGIVALAIVTMNVDGCDINQQPQSASGVTQTSTKVQIGSDGLTAEQRNVKARLEEDNKPGAIKHLYIISPYSGQVIIYSTVKGKVTSGGKRLTPTTISGNKNSDDYCNSGTNVSIAGRSYCTPEVLQDDGTYGQSGDYLYWWDVQGRYHQHYLTGGQIVHISSQPIPVKSITINMEATN